jgi:hypothetical protein
MHTDAAQTADLHALPAFAEWARARGFRVGDWVWCESEWHKGELLVIDVGPHLVYDDGPCRVPYLRGAIRGDTCGRDVADCRLMPSESDLFAYIRSRGFGTISFVLLDGGEEGVELWKHGERWGYAATTRIGALVAAVVAVGGGE